MSERTDVWGPGNAEATEEVAAASSRGTDAGEVTQALPVDRTPPVDLSATEVSRTAAPTAVSPAVPVAPIAVPAVPPAVVPDDPLPTFSSPTVVTEPRAPTDETQTLHRPPGPFDDRATDGPDGPAGHADAVTANPTRTGGASASRVPQFGPLPLPLVQTAVIVGRYRWVEHALYALLGRWVEDAALPVVQVHLDAQSMRHAWHAELWAERLPVLASSNPDRLTVPSPAMAALFRLLGASVPRTGASGEASGSGFDVVLDAGTADVPGTLPRLAALYRVVLPRLVATYEQHWAVTAEPTDGPVRRALRLVLNDEIEDWRAGERLVQQLMTRPHDVAVVVEYQRRLEAAIVGAGGHTGLVRIPVASDQP